MENDTFYELTRRHIPVPKNETAYLSWRDSVLIVKTTKRLNLFEYSYNLLCLDKSIDFIESFLPSPKASPATELCNSQFIKDEMRNVDYTEMIVNSSFWPHNASLTQEMTSITATKWSPTKFYKSQAVLAVLNNIGGVEFYAQRQSSWKSMLNLSPYITKALQYNTSPTDFTELKESVNIVETSAICWAQELNTDNSCYFVTAQKNGRLLFWQIYYDLNNIKLQGSTQTDMTDINQIMWVQQPDGRCCLVCANELGQIKVFNLQINTEEITVLQSHTLWSFNDRMVANKLMYTSIDNHTVIICNKHRFLLIFVLGQDNSLLTHYLNNINDYRITDITKTSEGLYLTTVNVHIFKMNITYVDSILNVDLIPLVMKDTYASHELYSLRFSENNVLCALAMVDRKVLCRKENHKIEIIFITTDSKLESILPVLMNNPTNKLTNYWDCIEMFRLKITKLKVLPQLEYTELLDAGSHDKHKMKIYLIILTIFTNLKNVLRINPSIKLPEMSLEMVKEKILSLHAQFLQNSLCKKYQNGEKLTNLEIESLYGSKNYLVYYSKKYKTNIELNNSVDSVLCALKMKCEYTCQCCDSKIDCFTCREGHLNMYCTQSFTPIYSEEYLVCKSCGTTARPELILQHTTCVFCDQYLVET